MFVHVALVKEIASSMQYIRDETELMDDEHDAKAAIFYSISSTQKGLQVRSCGKWLALVNSCGIPGSHGVVCVN